MFVSENNEVYRYLINNATFESLDRNREKGRGNRQGYPRRRCRIQSQKYGPRRYIVQHINYPTPVDIDTYYTDSTGKLMMPEPLSFGNYELIEQCSAYGYVLGLHARTVQGGRHTDTVSGRKA